MTAINAIETSYAGCRFRSRLEARWAVFFDTLGITWEHEPQGFTCEWRLSLRDGTFPYLPDFYLPQFDLWAEVKGSLTTEENVRLLNAAAHLSGTGTDLLVLGPVPRPMDRTAWQQHPVRLHLHKGDLTASPWPGGEEPPCFYIAHDHGDGPPHGIFDSYMTEQRARSLLLEGTGSDSRSWYIEALTAARSARFEHGETGANHTGRRWLDWLPGGIG